MDQVMKIVTNCENESKAMTEITNLLVERGYNFDDTQRQHLCDFYLSKWFRFYVNHDPGAHIRRIPCAVLVVQGEDDNVVTPDDNLALLTRYLREGNVKDVTVKRLIGVDHMLHDGRIDRQRSTFTISPVVLHAVSAWIPQHSASPSPSPLR
jgi:uncharacterized protein